MRAAHLVVVAALLAGGLLVPRFSIAVEPKKRSQLQSKDAKQEKKETKASEPPPVEAGCRGDFECGPGSVCSRPDHFSVWSCKRR